MFKNKLLTTVAYLYLLLPLLLFIIMWVTPIISVPLLLMMLYSFYSSIKNSPLEELNYQKQQKKILIIIGAIAVWVILSGIGGFVWQNRYDHMFRNAIFSDLFLYDWPVVNNHETLCYYIGYWLPSALVAKIGEDIHIGYICQLIWGIGGVVIAFFLLSLWLKKISYKALFIFIFFSGLDIVIGVVLSSMRHTPILSSSYLESLIYLFQSSSNTTLLFWVYNQVIPFWVGFFLLINQKNNKYLFFTYSLLFLYSPFPSVGLLPCMIYWMFKDFKVDLSNLKTTARNLLKTYLTIENITGLLIFLVLASYYNSNVATGKVSSLPFTFKTLYLFLLYLILEYLIYAVFIYKRIKSDKTFWVLFITMGIFSFILLGTSYDFGWRTCIPFTAYLMLQVIREAVVFYDKTKIKSKLLIVVLLIGSVTPIFEIGRTIYHTIFYDKYGEPFLSDGLDSVFDNFSDGSSNVNFLGKSDSFFYKYIMRKSDSEIR